MSTFLRRLIVALLLGVLVYGAFAIYAGLQELGTALSRFSWWTMAAAIGLSSLNYCLRFLKWLFYLRRLGVEPIPHWENFLVFLSGFVLTVTPGKVGEVFKSAVLRKTHGVDPMVTAPIIVAERLTDVIAIVALVALGSMGFSGGTGWALAGGGAVLLGLLIIVWDAPLDMVFLALKRRGGRLAATLPRLETARESLKIVASPSALLIPTAISIVGWACEGVGLWLLLDGFGAATDLLRAEFFYSTSTLAGALVPVPGGLGVTEAIMQSQLVGLGGVPKAAATGAMLMIRFATLWWAVLVGFAALGLLRLRFPHVLRD